MVARAAGRRERRTATLNLIRDIKGSPAVLERLARTYSFRRVREGRKDYCNPYTGGPYSYEHDLICILNFFEVVCAEIENGSVERQLIKDTADDMVVGAFKQIEELRGVFGKDIAEQFPNLVKLGGEWQDTVSDDGVRIPDIKPVDPHVS